MAFDWNTAFRRAGQVKSADEAAQLVNDIGTAFCLLHFRLKEANIELAGTISSQTYSPLRAEAAFVFEDLSNRQPAEISDRLQSSNEPFWVNGSWMDDRVKSHIPLLLCCPVRYASSSETTAYFLAESEQLGDKDAICLQACLVRILERFLALGILLKQTNQPLSERERVCLEMYSKGNSIAQIAKELDQSDHVVVASMNIACSRLLANNLSHAIAIAIRSGLI